MPTSRTRFAHALVVGVALLLSFGASPAAAADRVPASRTRLGALPQERVQAWVAPAVDLAALEREDESNRGRRDIPYRIGFAMATDLSPSHSGTWEKLPGGGSLWRLRIRTEGALWTVLGFDRFRLQYGASLWIYDPDQTAVLGPFTGADITGDGQLWLPPVEGDSLVVELFWPDKLHGQTPDLHLGTVSHGYKAFGSIGAGETEGFGDSGPCNIDVQCPLGANWQDEKRGIVMLLSGGTGFCSGSLINTTADDCRPYVLTAAHCSAGSSTSYGFNYERPACGSGTPLPVTTQVVFGGTVLANYPGSDFTLIQMSSAPPESFNVYYNGWSRDPNPAAGTIVIHHPRADAKKISEDVDPPTNGTNYGSNHWRIAQYEQGTTEGGSSGSPLFDQNSRIVGQLHGGTASCTSITWDEYGKVDASWTGGGTAATRLSSWLDPEGTGAMYVDGVDWSTCAFRPAGEVLLTRDLYACSDTGAVTLRDDSLQGSASQTVEVASTTEPAPEVITLYPIEPGSGRFTGSFPIVPGPAASGDAQLSVSHGDTLTVTYIDADDGSGGVNVPRTDTAVADCAGPVISAVQALNVTGHSAVIVWTTDEASNSAVAFGLAGSPPPGSTTSAAALVTSHSVLLTGLEPCRDYIFFVASTDAAGNPASDDNAGTYYAFTTGTNVNPVYSATGLPLAIPDSNPAGISSTITVTDPNSVVDVDVRISVTHTFDGDLDIFLKGPNGVEVELSTDNGGDGNDFTDTVFDDEAAVSVTTGTAPFTGSFRPETPLSAFDGISAAGTWTLRVVDDAPIDLGSLDSFELILSHPPQPCGAYVRSAGSGLADSCTGGGPSSGDGVADPGEDLAIVYPLRNTGTDPATSIVATLSSSTPGVTVTGSLAAYADLPVGGLDPGSDPFLAHVDGSVACGEVLDFLVTILSDQGSWSEAFSVQTGQDTYGSSSHPSTDVPKPIPTVSPPVVTSNVSVAAAGTVADVNVTLNISHTFDADLDIFLIGPDGTRVELSTDNGGSADGFIDTTFDDQAATSILLGAFPFTASYRPEGSLATLNGIPAAGTWTLEITDDAGGDSGVLNSWRLDLVIPTGRACGTCTLAPPGETSPLLWSDGDGKSKLDWPSIPGALEYAVFRGGEADLPALLDAGPDSCEVGVTGSSSLEGLSATPASGSIHWYLVRASNDAGLGPAGEATAGPRVHDPAGFCP